MYRLIIESLLGLRREGDVLHLAPCLPADWPDFTMRYRYWETMYHVDVTQTLADLASMTLDGVDQPDLSIPLVNDRQEHVVKIVMSR